jgi:aryl-alcohol dehydrogenase-like predicted oxidoreductase
MAPGLYSLRVKGRLGVTALSAFPSLASELKGGETVLTGVLTDRAALYGVVAQIEALGLELLELRQIGPSPPAREGQMTTRTFLGDKPINRMGFGAMQLAGPGVFGPPRDRAVALAVLRRAIEVGVDHIDTAQYYGPDVVNDLICQALHPYPEDLKLVTKVGARRDAAGRVLPAQRPDELRAGVEANLRSLRVERLDLVNLRLVETGDDTAVPLEAQLSAMEDMRREGKLDLIGLSNVDLATVQRALEFVDVAEIQNGYSIIDRRGDEMIDFARKHEIAFAPFFPLGSGFAGGPARLAGDAIIVRVAEKHAATTTQIALAWLLARYDRMLLIPGTSSVAHLEENMAAGELELDDADLAALDGV